MKTPLYVVIILSILLATGCQGSPITPQATETTEPPALQQVFPQTPSQSPTEEDNNLPMPDNTQVPQPEAQKLIQLAAEHLAQKLQIDVALIHVAGIEAVTWPDASLGCPQMGMAYIQVLTPGYKITLEANGKTYPYHTDDKDSVILCALRPGGEYFISPTP
ncbi:MAG: hypothetical protein AB1649_04600 [Chloroflexota bacterium]